MLLEVFSITRHQMCLEHVPDSIVGIMCHTVFGKLVYTITHGIVPHV